MDIERMLAMMGGRATKENFAVLLELEQLSEQSNILYPHIREFIGMTGSEQYGIRVRGFRLLCKQARWDTEHIIDGNLDAVLEVLNDEKPTVVRQALAALHDVILYKKELHEAIRERVLAIDCFRYKDTMQGLILKDIQELLAAMEGITETEQL